MMEKSIILFVFVISSSLAVQVSYSDQIFADSIDIDNLPSDLNKRATHPFDKTLTEVPTIPSKPKGGRMVGSIGRAATAGVTAGGAADLETASGEATAGSDATAGGATDSATASGEATAGGATASGEATAGGATDSATASDEATAGGAATVRGGSTSKAALTAPMDDGATRGGGVVTDVEIESRPNSPAKYFEWSYNKRPFPPMVETEFVYCPNESFVSGVSAMTYQGPEVKYGISMLRFSCSTMAGDYDSDIYVGTGTIGTYESFRNCTDENDFVAKGLDIDYQGDDCHPGVTDVGICGNLLPPENPETLQQLQCSRLTAVCGVAVRRNQLTLPKDQDIDVPCKNERDFWGPVGSITQIGVACCMVDIKYLP